MHDINAIDDRLGRWVGIPGFGMTIPHATGLFGDIAIGDPSWFVGLVWFIGLAGVVWQGNRWLLFRQRERLDWFTNPWAKVFFLVVGCVFFTAPVTACLLMLWGAWSGVVLGSQVVGAVVLVNVICVLVVTHMYETAFLIQERADDRLEVAELRRANAEGQLAALQSQMDPHFLFNSLTTLRWLIASDPEGATAYTGKLAQVYRYILMNRNRHLVQLPDEIAFFDACFHLLKIRFGSAIRLQLEGLEGSLDRLLVPPISLQVLLENAVKHNAFSVQEPLEIKVCLHEDHLEVANRVRLRSADGARVGLANLAERYRLSMNREVQIEQADGWFRVRIPVAVVA